LVLKKAKKVMVQSKSKHCHSIATANSQQVSVLCCVSTATPAVSPLIVVSKELPVGCNFQREGPCSECLLEIQRQCLCLSPTFIQNYLPRSSSKFARSAQLSLHCDLGRFEWNIQEISLSSSTADKTPLKRRCREERELQPD